MADETTSASVDFTTFVLSLGSSALVHLGDMSHPEAGNTSENLLLARQTIDILAMLEEKTRGNLTRDEEKAMKAILQELQSIYVQMAM